jgi:putative ABC transport system permease protein
MSRDDRWFRALLRLFPSEFRGDFGRQMEDDFREQRDDAAARDGPRGPLRLWLRTVADVLRRAPLEHADVLRRDAVHAIRILRKRPASTVTVIASIAIAIGLNIALFTVVSQVLWQSLPFAGSDRLVAIVELDPAFPERFPWLTPGDFVDLREHVRAFSRVAAGSTEVQTIVEPGEPEDLAGMMVSEGYFETIGAQPALGRTFTDADYAEANIDFSRSAVASRLDERAKGQPLARGVVVISHQLWQRRFLGRPDVVGQELRLASGVMVEVVGVMGPEMRAIALDVVVAPEWWMPRAPSRTGRGNSLATVARLAPGQSLDSARAELATVGAGIAAAFPGAKPDRTFRAFPLLEMVVRDVRSQLMFLLGASLCVLLVTCVNVVHLFLANGAGRRVELATRVALGATRGTLIRQTLTESAVLATIGGAGGLLLAGWSMPLLVSIAPQGIPRLDEIRFDWWAYACGAVATMVVSLFCGVAASLPLTIIAPWRTLSSARSGRTLEGRHARRVLAVGEIAVALVLVVAAMLMVRTMRALLTQDLGFNPEGVISAALPRPARPALDADAPTLVHEAEVQVIDAVARLPGVVAAGVGGSPLGLAMGVGGVRLPGDPRELPTVGFSPVSVGYFEALGVRLKEGRLFNPEDRAGAPAVAIVGESTARKFWPAVSAVGQTMLLPATRPPANRPVQVVGVITDMTEWGLEMKVGGIFVPHLQVSYATPGRMVIKTDRDPQTLVPAIEAIVRRVNPEHPFPDVTPVQAEIDRATAPRRFVLRLIGLFSILGVALAVIGIYGVLAESVAERIPEIGVRIALGAQPSDVVRLIVRQGAWMIVAGICFGLAGAAAVSRPMTAMVFGVGTLDPLSYLAACAMLALAGLAACTIPARRAASLDPVVALRHP